jgi:putative tryptophan/tyrosine transport system substrate-binding protein
MGQDTDPVGSGFIFSLARPGGNITGLAALAPEMAGKQLELLKEIVPRLSRLAVFGNSTHPGNAQALKETELAAGALAVQLQYLDVRDSKDIGTAFRDAREGHVDAVLSLENAVLNSHRKQVLDLAAKSRLPAMYPQTEYMEARGLMYLWREHCRLVSARCQLCGQDFERRKAW